MKITEFTRVCDNCGNDDTCSIVYEFEELELCEYCMEKYIEEHLDDVKEWIIDNF